MLGHIKTFAIGMIVATGLAAAVSAQNIAAPQGDALLTISGDIDVVNVGDTLQLDSDALRALDETKIETSTIWTEGVHTFEGVSLAALAELVGAQDGVFMASAINDYTVEIPVADAVEGGPIIAYLMDGEAMSVRDKGPLWVIYPYDESADFRSEVVYSRSIWQLDRIEVVK